MKILNLVLTYEWFDKIKSGEKTKEYREYKPYWNKKFFKSGYNFVRFQRGYKDSEIMIFKIKKIFRQIGGQNDLNLLDVWVIELGERVDCKRCKGKGYLGNILRNVCPECGFTGIDVMLLEE